LGVLMGDRKLPMPASLPRKSMLAGWRINDMITAHLPV
jgi:hypothetical protein